MMSIKLVHFTNPSRFYFRNLADEDEEIQAVEAIEEDIGTYIDKLSLNYLASLKFYQPRVGEVRKTTFHSIKNSSYHRNIVFIPQLVAFSSSKKYIRCVVDESKKLNGVQTVILWAIDYGLPLYTTHLNNLIPLKAEFNEPKSKILTGCLAVMPSANRFDYDIGELVKDIKDSWSDLALRSMGNLAQKCQQVFFIPSHQISDKELYIGDIFFGNISLSFCLVDKEAAVTVQPNLFFNYYSKLYTKHIERWNDNSRTGGILKHQDASEFDYGFAIKKTPQGVDHEKAGESSFTEESFQKVLEWQDRNEEFFRTRGTSQKSESVISFEDDLMKHFTINPKHLNSPAIHEPEVDEYSGVSADKLRQMLEAQVMQQKKQVYHRQTSRSISFPAGSNMINFSNENSFDENFVSVSQEISGLTSVEESADDSF